MGTAGAGCGCVGDVPATKLPFTRQFLTSEKSTVMSELFIPRIVADIVLSFNCLSPG